MRCRARLADQIKDGKGEAATITVVGKLPFVLPAGA
jgi:hypothetical protein